MNEKTKKFIKISSYVVIITLLIRCALSWNEIETNIHSLTKIIYILFGYAGESITITAILMALFNKWLWKIKIVNSLLGKEPIMKGKYQAKIKYEYNGKACAKDACIIIEQSYLNCTVKMTTNESESLSLNASFITINNDCSLIATYINTPKIEFRKNSPIHYGTLFLKSRGENLYGSYFTDRNTSGDIETCVDKE